MGIGKLLDYLPALMQAYGRWPTFVILVIATAQPFAVVVWMVILFKLAN